MKRSVQCFLSAVALALVAQSAFAADVKESRVVKEAGKPGVVSTRTTTEKVEIVAVDQAKRTISLKTPDGDTENYKVSTEVRNLAQVKAGDILTAQSVEHLAIYSKQSKSQPSIKSSYTITRAPKGAKPGMVATRKLLLTGKVQLVNYQKRTISVSGPHGKGRTFDVAPDVKNLKTLKPGDLVVVHYTDKISIAVATPKK